MHTERATSSEVRRWLEEAVQEGRTHLADRVAPVAAALQRLSDTVEEDRAQAAAAAGEYTPHQLQVALCPPPSPFPPPISERCTVSLRLSFPNVKLV